MDLQQLKIERPGPKAPRAARSRHVATRWLLPAAIVLGFEAILAWAVRDWLLPSKPVSVVPVVVSKAEVQQEGTPLFQAAGWIEPRPQPVIASALVEGVVEKILVVEGEEVQAGQPVAKLIDVDAQLALERAEADRLLKEAEHAGAKAEWEAAQARWKQPLHLEAALAEADSLLAQAEAESARLPYEIRTAEARRKVAEQDLEGKRAAGTAIAERLVQKAQGELDSARSALEELREREPRLNRVVETLRTRRTALARQLELRPDESRQLASAEAKLKAAEAQARQADLAVKGAKLNLQRMTVRAPQSGRVLKIVATPGARLMGMSAHSGQDSSTVLSLYDPGSLQVRADVRLEDVRQVQPGQPVRIETASAPAPIEGEVLYVTSAANVQKNTLEVKVGLKSPPPVVRPDMLVQATFLAVRPSGPAAAPRLCLLVPRALVQKGDEATRVWVADPAGIARRQPIELGRAGTSELVEVVEGLHATDRLISAGREGLTDRARIRITAEGSE